MRIIITNVKNSEKLKPILNNYGIVTEYKNYTNKIIVGYSSEEEAIKAINGIDKMYIENRRVSAKLIKIKNNNKTVENIKDEISANDKYHKDHELLRVTNILDLKEKLSLKTEEFKKKIIEHFSPFFRILEVIITDEVILKVVKKEENINKKIIFYGKIVKYKKIININLFITFSSVLNNVEDKISFINDKELGVKSTKLETEIIQNNIKFLEENGIDIKTIVGINKKGLIVRNENIIDGIKARISTNGSLSLLYFRNEEECERNKKMIEQKCRYVEYMPVSAKVEIEKDKIKNVTNKLVIKNIPFQATKQEIKKLFDKFKIKNIRVPINSEGRIRGFAFIEVESLEEARQIYEWYGKYTHLYGRRLIIDYSNN